MREQIQQLTELARDYRDFCMVNLIDEGIHILRGEDTEHFSLQKIGRTIEVYVMDNYETFSLRLDDDKVEINLNHDNVSLPMSCTSKYLNELVADARNYLTGHLIHITRNSFKKEVA